MTEVTLKAADATTDRISPSGRDDLDRLSAYIGVELLRLSNIARTEAASLRGGGGFAARRSERFYLKFLQITFVIFFIIPTLVGAGYYLFFASNQYTTESYISLSSQSSGVRAALSGILGSESSAHVSQIVEYVHSPNILDDISSTVEIKHMFSREDIDPFSRLPSDAAIEERLKFWRSKVHVERQSFTSQIRIRLRAFSPEDSLFLHQTVLQASERHVNEISRANQFSRIAEVQQSVDRARSTYSQALDALRQARETHGLLDAEAAAKGYQTILTTLYNNAATLERRIGTIRSQSASSPQLPQLVTQLEVTQDQINRYEQLIASPTLGLGTSIATMAADLDARQMDLDIARTELASRIAVLEAAKSEALGQGVYLLQSVEPSLPEKSVYPNRLLNIIIVFFGSLLSWLLLAGLGLLIRDNMT